MFTSNQIQEILRKIAACGVKDTHFPLTDIVKMDDVVAIVQDGVNKIISIETLLDCFEQYIEQGGTGNRIDFFNVSRYGMIIHSQSTSTRYTTLADAIAECPDTVKIGGMVITYLGPEEDDTWYVYQFQSDSPEDWSTVTKWVKLHPEDSTETDPIFSASPAAGITQADIDYWNSLIPSIGVQSDWNETDPDSLAYILNKPTSFVSVESYNPTLSYGDTSSLGKIDGVEFKVTMPAAPSSPSSYASIEFYINEVLTTTYNPMDVSSSVFEVTVPTSLSNLYDDLGVVKTTDITDYSPGLLWNQTHAVGKIGGTELHVTMPADPTANLASVAFSGNYSDINGAPTDISTFNNDAGYLTSSDISVSAYYNSGNKIADITIDGVTKEIYESGSGGSGVTLYDITTSVGTAGIDAQTWCPTKAIANSDIVAYASPTGKDTSNNHYVFDHWSITQSGNTTTESDNPLQLTISDDTTMYAVYNMSSGYTWTLLTDYDQCLTQDDGSFQFSYTFEQSGISTTHFASWLVNNIAYYSSADIATLFEGTTAITDYSNPLLTWQFVNTTQIQTASIPTALDLPVFMSTLTSSTNLDPDFTDPSKLYFVIDRHYKYSLLQNINKNQYFLVFKYVDPQDTKEAELFGVATTGVSGTSGRFVVLGRICCYEEDIKEFLEHKLLVHPTISYEELKTLYYKLNLGYNEDDSITKIF